MMRSCAIMQPTYLPWAGYFNLISSVDVFVFLDDVHFERSSWHHRNKILSLGKPLLLTIPVQKLNMGGNIDEVYPDNQKNWRKKHIQSILQSYSKAKFRCELDSITDLIDRQNGVLSEFNISIITLIMKLLEINVEVYRASDLGIYSKRTNRVIDICNKLAAGNYHSPLGAKEYLVQDNYYDLTENSLFFQEYQSDPYYQRGRGEFVSHLSIIDTIANLGIKKTVEYINRGTFQRSYKGLS